MDEPDRFRDELDGDVSADERAQLWRIADGLIGARPFPRAAFRAALHGHFARGISRGRPSALWARVAALAVPGIVMLALVAIGVAHSGPFAG